MQILQPASSYQNLWNAKNEKVSGKILNAFPKYSLIKRNAVFGATLAETYFKLSSLTIRSVKRPVILKQETSQQNFLKKNNPL